MDPDSDPDPDPAIFVIDLQDASKKLIFLHNFLCLLLFEATFTSFFKDKKSKRVPKTCGSGGSGSTTLLVSLAIDRCGTDIMTSCMNVLEF
jgi:hypothetical protein